MKKVLLIALGSGLWLCAGAQSSNQAVALRPYLEKKAAHQNDAPPAVGNFYTQGTQSRNIQGKNARVASTGIVIGTAFNAYGVLDASTTAVTCTQKTSPSIICMTHRDQKGGAYGSGAYQPSFSTNGGNTWDSTDFTLFRGQSSRYPNGVIFNPAGNTDPTKAFLATAGPWTNNAAAPAISWVKTVYGSMRFDTSFRSERIMANATAGVYPQNTGNLSYMTSCDDSTVHVIGIDYNENAAQTAFTRFMGGVITTGKFSPTGDTFHWTQQVVRPHLWSEYKGATAGSPYDSGAYEVNGSPGMAWSQDGKTGYVIFFANLDSAGYNFGTWQPIVYKSINSGATWAMLPPQNFANIPNLVQYLTASGRITRDSGRAYPLWNLVGQMQGDENDYDAVVDMNGNLHIVGSIEAAYYASPDSSYNIYSFNYPKFYLYDVYTTTPSGGWKARFIDSMACRPAYSVSTTPWSTSGAAVSYGARIQTTRTVGGDKIFYTWEDDLNPALDSTSMNYPDIKGMGVDIAHGTATSVRTWTGTNDQFFACVSDLALVSGSYPNSVDSIPVVYVRSPNNNNGTAPVEFCYQAGVVYVDSMFVLGENEIVNNKPGFSVSGNYPNPFNGNTYFKVTLDNESTVAVDVFNMLGEKVQTIAPAHMSPGVHTITLESKNLNTGVYFYRVTANNETITHKMVIE